jgi:hypothetical protein
MRVSFFQSIYQVECSWNSIKKDYINKQTADITKKVGINEREFPHEGLDM